MRHENGTPQLSTLPGKGMEALARRLAEWRQTHNAPTAIPEELWERAVELARQYGVGPTARAVRLDHGTLRKRVQTSGVKTPAATFVELLVPPPALNDVSECAIEVESVRGSRMRIQMTNLAPAGLAAIIREFAG